MKDEDRRTILRRRAYFVTTALAALGSCARATTGANQPDNTVQVPAVSEDAGASDDAALPRSTFDSSRADMPPTDIPDGVKPFTRSQYEHLYKVMRDLHAHLDTIEGAVGRCKGFDQECERGPLLQIAIAMNGLDDVMERIHSCGGKSPEATLYMERESAHLHYVSERRSRVEGMVTELLAPGGAKAQERLKSLREAGVVPRPCLEYACPDW